MYILLLLPRIRIRYRVWIVHFLIRCLKIIKCTFMKHFSQHKLFIFSIIFVICKYVWLFFGRVLTGWFLNVNWF